MSKHPGPWNEIGGHVFDFNGKPVSMPLTSDPETRAVLLHAAEMWETLNEITSVEPGSQAHRHADKMCCELMRKIEAEIAAAKGTT